MAPTGLGDSGLVLSHPPPCGGGSQSGVSDELSMDSLGTNITAAGTQEIQLGPGDQVSPSPWPTPILLTKEETELGEKWGSHEVCVYSNLGEI